MSDTTLNLAVIASSDTQRALETYRMLGLAFLKKQHGSGSEHYSPEIARLVLEVYLRQPTELPGRIRLRFRVPSVDAAILKIREQGATMISEARASPSGRRAVVSDPDGHRVELSENPA